MKTREKKKDQRWNYTVCRQAYALKLSLICQQPNALDLYCVSSTNHSTILCQQANILKLSTAKHSETILTTARHSQTVLSTGKHSFSCTVDRQTNKLQYLRILLTGILKGYVY